MERPSPTESELIIKVSRMILQMKIEDSSTKIDGLMKNYDKHKSMNSVSSKAANNLGKVSSHPHRTALSRLTRLKVKMER